MTNSDVKTNPSHISFDRASSSNLSNEKAPLLGLPISNALQSSDLPAGYVQRRRNRQRVVKLLMAATVAVFVGLVLLVVVRQRSRQNQVNATAAAEKSLKKQVTITDQGDYTVHYARKELSSNSTLSELAQLMLPVWYEASVLATSSFSSLVNPSDVQQARKCLLITRDLLDVFGSIYPHRQWNILRGYYKDGYELAGQYQDLDHAHVAYNRDLWASRLHDLLKWKSRFESYQARRHVLEFLMHPISEPSSCMQNLEREKESHLFWSSSSSSSDASVPCGNDLATHSLQTLAIAQLTNALMYLRSILRFEQVLDPDHQEAYHNFRKELRSFADISNLFGFVLMPTTTQGQQQQQQQQDWEDGLATLKIARKLLGKINDDWTAYDLYKRRGTHPKEQDQLQREIDPEWDNFKTWAKSHDLEGTIRNLIEHLK